MLVCYEYGLCSNCSIFNIMPIHSEDLNSRLVLISDGRMAGLQLFQILNGIWNLEAQPLEIWTNGHYFVKSYLKSWKKCHDFESSGFIMVGTTAIAKGPPFENRTIWNPTLKKYGFKMFADLEWSDFRSRLYIHGGNLLLANYFLSRRRLKRRLRTPVGDLIGQLVVDLIGRLVEG